MKSAVGFGCLLPVQQFSLKLSLNATAYPKLFSISSTAWQAAPELAKDNF